MVREDLVSSAVSFLQDPSVAASTLDKRIAFLQSKNLTQEEIDVSLARAGDVPSSQSQPQSPQPPPAYYGYPNPQMMRPPAYGYQPYPPWGPPEPPKRDWRDWFIMATVTTGVGYGMYEIAKRYILPLISPPTPPQLASDKASIDASFARAFALIDQLSTDTASLRTAEAARAEKLDTTLSSITSVIEDLKAANVRRESESRIIADQVAGLKNQIPQALESWKQGEDAKVEEVRGEVLSLKKLLQNRVGQGGGAPQTPNMGVGRGAMYSGWSAAGDQDKGSTSSGSGAAAASATAEDQVDGGVAPAPGVTVPKRESSSPRFGRGGGAAIPAWQMAAKKGNDGGTTEAGS
ncbi:MAG: hypothetical protein Q9195_004898 [Heterodermia aff. obscurata]